MNLKCLHLQKFYVYFGLDNQQINSLQWLAFRNDGKYSAADYGKIASEKVSNIRAMGESASWNRFEEEERIKRRRNFVIKLFQGAMKGLAYMHEHDRLHQSLGPSSIVLKYVQNVPKIYSLCKIIFRPLHGKKKIRPFSSLLYFYSKFEMNDSTIAEREAVYLVPRLRDLAFSVDIR